MKSLRLYMNQAPSFFSARQPEELKRAHAVRGERRAKARKLVLDNSPPGGSVKIKLSDRWR
jgi:hypothetical protein